MIELATIIFLIACIFALCVVSYSLKQISKINNYKHLPTYKIFNAEYNMLHPVKFKAQVSVNNKFYLSLDKDFANDHINKDLDNKLVQEIVKYVKKHDSIRFEKKECSHDIDVFQKEVTLYFVKENSI